MKWYVIHYDDFGQQWNVYRLWKGQETYVCSFLNRLEAIAFCASANAHSLVGG